jgi:hypothetical protein
LQAVYIGGNVDFTGGTVANLVLPKPTAALLKSNKESTVDERAEALKRMLDTNNGARPEKLLSAMASHRNLENHDLFPDGSGKIFTSPNRQVGR